MSWPSKGFRNCRMHLINLPEPLVFFSLSCFGITVASACSHPFPPAPANYRWAKWKSNLAGNLLILKYSLWQARKSLSQIVHQCLPREFTFGVNADLQYKTVIASCISKFTFQLRKLGKTPVFMLRIGRDELFPILMEDEQIIF